MFFSIKMAWLYFKKIWSKGVLGTMVIISIAGIALGVSALVVTLSVMNGFHSKITSKLLLLNPHVVITHPFNSPEKNRRTMESICEIKNVKECSGFVFNKGLLQKGNSSQGVVIKGIDPENIHMPLNKGEWESLKDNKVIIGKELADMLNLNLGDNVYLIIPRLEQVGAPIIPRIEKLKIEGIFESGMYEYDSGLGYISIDTAEKIFPLSTSTRGIEIYVSDPFQAKDVSQILEDKLGNLYTVSTWKERNYNLFAALKLEKFMMFLVLVMIILVATFNIIGSLIMISVTKARDYGIMRALGATKRQIRMLFNFNGVLMGFFGSIFGTIIGLILCLIVSKYEIIKLPPKVYLISTLPVKVNPADIAIIIATALLVSFIATIFPARKAGKMDVAEVLRYE